MLIFVDYEHAERYKDGNGSNIQAARTWIGYRLEDLSDLPCLLVRWNKITPELLKQVDAKAIFISGNGADPSLYGADELEPLYEIIRTSGLPIFGFCGGFQCFAQAFGSELKLIDVADDAEETEILKKWPNGYFGEIGYHPIELTGEHALLDGLGEAPVFRHAHGLHIPDPPAGFQVLARTEITPVQLAVNDELRIIGTQFHPEYWTDEHPAGRTLIENFIRWANIID
jgi:GMP synthase (glutamine-hydrolysing)